MKKERNPIVVVLCMLLLLTVIVLPPTLRKLIPREEKEEQKDKNSITVLTCKKTFVEEQYEETATVRYINGKISTNRILYTKLVEVPEGSSESENENNESQGTTTENPNDNTSTPPEVVEPTPEDSNNGEMESPITSDTTAPENDTTMDSRNEESSAFKTVGEELAYFKSLNKINIKEAETKINVLINKKSITDNADDMKLINFFQDKLSDQQVYYESIGYTCSISES